MRKLKIAIFHLAFVYSGGGERLVLEEAIGLKKLGHDVTCFAPIVQTNNCFPELISKVRVEPLIPRLPFWLPDAELISILLSCVMIPFFFFKFRKYDIYFGANQPGPWFAYILSRINKKPYFIYLAQPTRLIHPRLIDQQVGLQIKDGQSMLINLVSIIFKPIINLCDTRSIKNSKLVFTNGSYAKGLLEEVYRIKTVNCPAGTHVRQRASENDMQSRFKGSIILRSRYIKKPYLLITNRHFPHKKFEYAIDAFLLLKNQKLAIVIAGKETNYTKFLKKKYKNRKNIFFLGLLSEEYLDRAYRNAAVYVYPAPEEDFGMGIIEAMAHSVPVVAWGNAGPTGIIKHEKDGMLARPFSIFDYSKQINKLLENSKFYKKIAKNGYQKVKKYFSFEAHNKKIDENIKRLLKR